MADVVLYNPESEGTVVVAEDSAWHYLRGGWVPKPEWDEAHADKAGDSDGEPGGKPDVRKADPAPAKNSTGGAAATDKEK